ncbi:hypothetical protein AWRI1631_41560 [Saccharomyces cerevisiae AWRI1631]|uniref:Uncharacterized protein n=1 Tax=Saccharomyces cerevisiae (strain AWRI1631) TaxID=545124 RepID=B5VFI5_YEAS6|nr:hypothetical protein AWRI1631_41560 [Saccharomyces cerevisiae AWRI1631]
MSSSDSSLASSSSFSASASPASPPATPPATPAGAAAPALKLTNKSFKFWPSKALAKISAQIFSTGTLAALVKVNNFSEEISISESAKIKAA